LKWGNQNTKNERDDVTFSAHRHNVDVCYLVNKIKKLPITTVN